MKPPNCLTFPALSAIAGFSHRFVLRCPETPVDGDRAEVLARLRPLHLAALNSMQRPTTCFCEAEQIHGAGVAVIDEIPARMALGVDGLITQNADAVLGIYVADCCAVYLVDPVTQAFGLVHAGKKGAELGIVVEALTMMSEHFGTRAADVVVQLSPCIRPPDYEVDFAAQVRMQCLEAGVTPGHLHDCELNTATDLASFYSYRMEQGRTGRMLALLGRSVAE